MDDCVCVCDDVGHPAILARAWRDSCGHEEAPARLQGNAAWAGCRLGVARRSSVMMSDWILLKIWQQTGGTEEDRVRFSLRSWCRRHGQEESKTYEPRQSGHRPRCGTCR